jgi:uncharacterized membrane protein YidH (DUF202 family)
MERSMGMVLVAVGVGVVLLGVLVMSGALSWFGRLPGDIRVEGERTRVFVPIVSMLVLSVVLTVVVNLVGRWFR